VSNVEIGLACALGTAGCYGVGSVLQAVAARRTPTTLGLDARLLLTLAGSWLYLSGLALDALGFVLMLVAVQSLPLFAVQAVVASFLAITAVLGAVFLHMSLSRGDWLGLGAVIGGLVLVGLSAAQDHRVEVSPWVPWGVLVVAVGLAAVAPVFGRMTGAVSAAGLGAVAGLAFGATSVAARLLPEQLSGSEPGTSLRRLATSPPTYALVLAGGVALLAYSTALQRSTVTAATAPLVVGETIAPALVGLTLLGDRPREGWAWAALLGFVLAVGGAVILARHGEIDDVATEQEKDRRAV
jgi:drug/metabolite transporter (DMT)-like permease